jgi:hypothetical protein
MRRLGVSLAVLLASGAVVARTFGAAAPGAGRVAPPGGILVSTNASHCYAPDSHIRVTVRNLAPGTSAQASSEETVAVAGRASTAGVAVITISAPTALPHGHRVKADLVEVVGTDATGAVVGNTAAFVLGTKRVCASLNRD